MEKKKKEKEKSCLFLVHPIQQLTQMAVQQYTVYTKHTFPPYAQLLCGNSGGNGAARGAACCQLVLCVAIHGNRMRIFRLFLNRTYEQITGGSNKGNCTRHEENKMTDDR